MSSMIDKTDTFEIVRYIENDIIQHLQPNKVIVIYGPRRVGKTTLVHKLAKQISDPVLWLNGENLDTQEWLSSRSLTKLTAGIGSYRTLIIDEAQRVDQIGLNLKILIDSIPNIRIIATGSSSFDLANQVGEPLVGRKWQYQLYPVAQLELVPMETPFESKLKLEERLIYGSYPEVVTTQGAQEKRNILSSIVDGALFKDLFMLDGIKNPAKAVQLAKAIALQVGGLISLTELSNTLDINLATVERYLDLLEKTFVIISVSGFRRNLRTELTKTRRYYFWDNGIRNSLINSFNPLSLRTDTGQLWENYIFIERMKKRDYQHIYSNIYFWRTHNRQEIDLVEERDGKLHGVEIKWSPSKGRRPPSNWTDTYPNAEYVVVNRENYLPFIT